MIDPAEYEFVACFYQGSSQEIADEYKWEHKDLAQAHSRHEIFAGNWKDRGQCDHCGARFAHGVAFLHTPSDTIIHVGHQCAENTVGLPDRASIVRRAAEKNAKLAAERQAAIEATPKDVREALEAAAADEESANSFILDLYRRVYRKGWTLSEKQISAARNVVLQEKVRQAKREQHDALVANAPALQEGRQTIEGEILSLRCEETMYGDSWKMLVQMDNGNRVWGGVPSAFLDWSISDTNRKLQGSRVRFAAQIQPKEGEDHFGFYKRPTKPEILEGATA